MLIGWTKTSSEYKGECDCPPDFKWKHGRTGEEVPAVNLDHYARVCPKPPFSRLLAEILYRKASETFRYHGNPIVSVTMLTSCPLHLWVERNNDYIDDPLGHKWMLRGTFAHEGLLRYAQSHRYIVEQPMALDIGGGRSLYGTLDVYDIVNNSIHDLKTQKWSAVKKKAGLTAKQILADPFVKYNVFQVNAYRTMWFKTVGQEAQGLYLHYWDGDLNEVEVEAPLVDTGQMETIITDTAQRMYDYLQEEDPSKIPPKDYTGFRWNPRDNSPLAWKIKEIMGG